MPVTISESDAFPSTLTAPAGGEVASAPGLVSQFLQGIANRSRYLYNRVNRLDAGGAFAPSDNLTITSPTGKSVTVNGLQIGAPVDGGDLASGGALKCMHFVTAAAVAGGTVSVPYYSEYVFGGATSSGATIWQITAPPAGSDASRRWVMNLANFSSFIVTVKDSLGATICTLQQAVSTANRVTIGFNGSTWDLMGLSYYHA